MAENEPVANPQPAPATPQPTITSGGNPWLKWIIVILIVSVISSLATFIALTVATKEQSIFEQGTISPEPSKAPNQDWKTYGTSSYSFQYPNDWTVKTLDYLNSVQIANPAGTVAITISEGQWPYGFGGPQDTTTNEEKITVAGKEYNVQETIMNGNSAFMNIKSVSPKDHYILLGTGSPASDKASLADYNAAKPTIREILASLTFTNQNANLSSKTYTSSGPNAGVTFTYPASWSEKDFEVYKYNAQIYVGYTNSEWFDKIANLQAGESFVDGRDKITKLFSGKVKSGQPYVIFSHDPSESFQGGTPTFTKKAYVLDGQTIYHFQAVSASTNNADTIKPVIESAQVQ